MRRLVALAVVFAAESAAAHETVSGVAVTPKKTERGWTFAAEGEAVLVPHCNGRGRVLVDGVVKDAGSKGPLVVRLGDETKPHDVTVEVKVSTYEKRIACSHAPRVGAIVDTRDGLQTIAFASPHVAPSTGQGKAGEAVLFVPGGHDWTKPSALLVGVHPWNSDPWTYAAYEELIDEAGKKDVVLLMPSGLGNSLYTADAEDEVMRAIDAVSAQIRIDPQRVSIWGASMGGAGATTISFHRPDRFAFVASYFGDSKYDLTTYVAGVLGGEAGARKVNALDHLENARHLPVFLVHGEADHTSPIRQSTMLYDAMKKAGFAVEFERVPGMAHEGPLVVKYIRRVVDRAALAAAPLHPARVSFRSIRPADTSAYGVTLVRASATRDAFVDVERKDDGVHVLAAEGVTEIRLAPGALGAKGEEPIVPGPGPAPVPVPVRWMKP
ncbi:MAG: prolyl oligopeptidase family serine peptidase [Labilithrix sp.]|nr:prolyl oligopeptidase family serine peptidase [Labilithrix sp.]MCW5810773.1 prolyl oligopeptidase family serine peptidase [Labilithrix sp.]